MKIARVVHKEVCIKIDDLIAKNNKFYEVKIRINLHKKSYLCHITRIQCLKNNFLYNLDRS